MNNTELIEEKLTTPVAYTADVLVVGGGIAGIAAAISAARAGAHVILTERSFMLGGLATAGLVTIYLPLCDGYGRQVSFGLAEELLRLSVKGCMTEKRGEANWLLSSDPARRTKDDPRFEADFNPAMFAIRAEQILLSLGVKILYGTCAVGAAVREDGKIGAVTFENKSGRFAVRVRSVVDASGDADVAKFSQTPTALFGQGNVLASWYYFADRTGLNLRMLGFCDIPEDQKKEKDAPPTLSDRRFGGIDGEELSEMTALSHACVLRDFEERHGADVPMAQIATLATIPQVRMTRRVDGEYTLSDREMHTPFADSIGMVSDWRRRGPVYEVPFRTLYNKKTPNLVFAGRCTSVTDGMWDIMRVIPCCAVTGEAAGLAAAMGDDLRTLDVGALQQALRERGVILHESDL